MIVESISRETLRISLEEPFTLWINLTSNVSFFVALRLLVLGDLHKSTFWVARVWQVRYAKMIYYFNSVLHTLVLECYPPESALEQIGYLENEHTACRML